MKTPLQAAKTTHSDNATLSMGVADTRAAASALQLAQQQANTSPQVLQLKELAAMLTGPLQQPITQLALNPDGGEQPGRMPVAERAGLDAFLSGNNHTAANYALHAYTAMKKMYAPLPTLDNLTNTKNANRRRRFLADLKAGYDALLAKADEESMDENSALWTESVAYGVAQYASLPASKPADVADAEDGVAIWKRNRDVDYTAIGTAAWLGRNPQPDAFWKKIRQNCRAQHGAVVDPAAAAMVAVLFAANKRFKAFRNDVNLNRGSWAGSDSHGAQPAEYAQTDASIIANLTARQVASGGRLGDWWIMASDTAPSGKALHRTGIDARSDFIYHL